MIAAETSCPIDTDSYWENAAPDGSSWEYASPLTGSWNPRLSTTEAPSRSHHTKKQSAQVEQSRRF